MPSGGAEQVQVSAAKQKPKKMPWKIGGKRLAVVRTLHTHAGLAFACCAATATACLVALGAWGYSSSSF